MDEDLKQYRLHLVEARQRAFEDFDKTVLALSAGALGISITFLKDLLGPGTNVVQLLFISWICWSLSVVSILISYFVSQLTIDITIEQIDAGDRPSRPGGAFATATKYLNASGGLLFLAGLGIFIIFISQNTEVINVKPK